MATASTSTVLGLFESRSAAEQAVSALVSTGFSRDAISVVASDSRSADDTPNIAPVETPGSFDAGTGAAVGGLAGFIGGVIALAIPGIGPIIAAGPLAAGLMGAGLGAATGGLIGGLKEHGVPEEDASRFVEAVRSGRVLVSAHVPEDRANEAADVMDDHGAIDTDELEDVVPTRSSTKTDFKPLSPEALEAARTKPGESLMERERERERRSQVFPGITGSGSTPNA